MKFILIYLICVMTPNLSWADNGDEQVILNQLHKAMTLEEKDSALWIAKNVDSAAVNDSLVKYLDDTSDDGPRQRDFQIIAPWKSALGILVQRFKLESMNHLYVEYNTGIVKVLKYTRMNRSDAASFKKWWSENRRRIEYRGNTHILTDANETPPKASEGPAPTTSTDLLDTQNGRVSEPESPTAHQKAPEAKPIVSTTSEEPTSSTPRSIIVVLVVAVIGLLCLLLKVQK